MWEPSRINDAPFNKAATKLLPNFYANYAHQNVAETEKQLDRQDKRMWMRIGMWMRMRMRLRMELRMGWRMPALTCRKWHRWWATSKTNSKCEIKVSQKSRNAHLKIINGKSSSPPSLSQPLPLLFFLLSPLLFLLLLLQRMPNNPPLLDWRRRWENCANFT